MNHMSKILLVGDVRIGSGRCNRDAEQCFSIKRGVGLQSRSIKVVASTLVLQHVSSTYRMIRALCAVIALDET